MPNLKNIAREKWLRSDDHELFAAAMMRCEHPDPSFCSSSGSCNLDGRCFESNRPKKCPTCGQIKKGIPALTDQQILDHEEW